jgi:hypothetical protein
MGLAMSQTNAMAAVDAYHASQVGTADIGEE